MVGTGLRYLAILLSAVVALSFGLFAIDQTREASATQRVEIAKSGSNRDEDAIKTEEAVAHRKHSEVRRKIDSVSEQITSPFAGLVADDRSHWVQRGVPALLALLVFGVGLGYLARYANGRAG